MRRKLRLRVALGLLAAASSACLRTDLLRGIDPIDSDLTIRVVIENPAGSAEKWEVRSSGRLVQEDGEDGRILIPHLPWPVNGAMIPRTLLSRELGGDGEPVDVLVLGPALPRAAVVEVRPVGLLRVIDALERDDKVLAVTGDSAFASVTDVEGLREDFPGVLEMLSIWFDRSRPGGVVEVQGYGSRGAANRLIAEGIRGFEEAERGQRMPEWTTR